MTIVTKNSKRVYSGPSGSASGGGSTTPTSITHAALLTLYNAGTMVPGFYIVSDRADQGIIIQAISKTQLAYNATGIFLNPDFASGGNYTGVNGVTGVPYFATVGVWTSAAEPGFVNGEVTFYNGLHYEVTNSAAFAGTNPAVSAAYTVLSKSIANVGYIAESDYIEYDFVNDIVNFREDRRLNRIYNISNFQWGNAGCSGNQNTAGISITNINQAGTFDYNTFIGSYNVTVTGGGSITANTFIDLPVLALTGQTLQNEIITINSSTNIQSYSITGLTTLDFTAALSFLGIANLTSSNATETINLFANFPIGVPVMLRPTTGLKITFTHATGVNQPICSGGISPTIDGSKGEWIQFIRRETYIGSAIYRVYQIGGETY